MTKATYSIFNDESIKKAVQDASMESSVYLREGDAGFELKKAYPTEGFEEHHRTEDCETYTLGEFENNEVSGDPDYARIYVSPRRNSIFNPGPDFSPEAMEKKGFKLIPVIETEHSTMSLRLGSQKSPGMHWDQSIAFVMLPPGSEVTEVTNADLQMLEDWMNNYGCQINLYGHDGALICSGDPVFASREKDALDALCGRLECEGIDALDGLTENVRTVDKSEFEEAFGQEEVVTIRRRSGPSM